MSADIAANEIDKLRNEIARLKGQTNWVCSCGGTDCKGQQENADLRDTLDAVIAADGRAVDLWRAAHPGKALVIPDRAKLVGWLLDQNAALRADKARLDWLERRTVSRLQAVLDHVELHKLPIREAIDLAIEEIGQ